MSTKDSITAVFMILTLCSWLGIASILSDIRTIDSEVRDGINCIAYTIDSSCDESVNISSGTNANALLTVK